MDAHHFTAFLLSPHPRPIANAIDRYRRGLDPDPEGYLFDYASDRTDGVLRAAAHYTGGRAGEIALTDSTTMGLGLLYRGLKLRAGDEILTSTHDFYSTHEALRQQALSTGATVRKIELYREPSTASADEMVSKIKAAIAPKTRVLALTWVHSGSGVKIPVSHIAEALAAVNNKRSADERVIFGVDGVHGFGNQDVDVAKLGCDFFVSGCHKWLFGPRGTGLIWGHSSAWRRTTATIPSFDGHAILNWIHPGAAPAAPAGARMTPGGFHSFEHRWAVRDAFAFNEAIGRDRIAKRTTELAEQLKEGLSRLHNVTLHTPRSSELSAGLVCFEVKTLEASAAVDELKRRGILASVTPYAWQWVRFGPSIVNTPDEVDLALKAIRKL